MKKNHPIVSEEISEQMRGDAMQISYWLDQIASKTPEDSVLLSSLAQVANGMREFSKRMMEIMG